MTLDQENITKAFQTSEFLVDEVREVYRKTENKLLQVHFIDLIQQAVSLNQKLRDINVAAE